MSTQYIGSRISLISKNDVRYEGTLYSIDPTKLEVVLQNVQSFGTEDRVTDNPIASSQGIYGYIAFSGPDIKELNVCEEAPPMGMPPDMGYGNPYGYPPQGYMMPGQFPPGYGYGNPYQQPYGYPYGFDPYSGYPPQQAFNQPQEPVQPQQEQGNSTVSPQSLENDSVTSVTNNENKDQESQRNISNDKTDNNEQQPSESQQSITSQEKQQDNVESSSTKKSYPSQTSSSLNVTPQPSEDQSSKQSTSNDNHSRNKSRGGKKNRGRQDYRHNRTNQRKGKQTTEQFKEDFDFESSLAKFDKEKFAAELIDGKESVDTDEDISDLTLAYEKSSFFDNISCEATDREAERERSVDYRESLKQQRKLDSATFGESARTSNRGRNRRYYNRGRRGNSNYKKRNYNNSKSKNNTQQSNDTSSK